MIIISIIRNILVRVGADIQPFSQGMTQAQGSLHTFQTGMSTAVNNTHSSMLSMGAILGRIGGIVAAAFAVTKMVEFGKGAVELASSLNEVQNVVDVTFGSMANQINDFSKTAITQFGISELSAKKFASTMGAMLKSSGITGQQLTNMSEGITGLSADMASFYNLDPETAFEKIRSGISGETEPLKQLGINMSVANMEAYALAQGIKTKYAAMDQASQSLLRYNYLMSVSKDAQGDFARTTNSWANQTRLLSQQWDIMKGTVGQGLINMLTPLLTVINAVISKLQVAAAYFKAFTEMIWGSAGAVSGVVLPAAGATDGMDAMGNSADKTGAKVKKAAAAIKGSLASFDQLNVLGQKAGAADDTGGLSAATGMPTVSLNKPSSAGIDAGALAPLKAVLDGIKNSASEVYTFMQKAFGPPLQAALGVINPMLQAWKTELLTTFNQFSTLGAPLKAFLVNDLVPVVQQYILLVGDVIAGVGFSLLMMAKTAREAVFPIIEWFVTQGLPLLASFASGAITVFKAFFDYAKFVFDTLWMGVVDPVMKVISKIILDCLNEISGFWHKFGTDIVAGIVATFNSMKELFNTLWKTTLSPIVKGLTDELTWLWDKHLKGVVTELLNFIGKLVTGAMEIYNKFFAPIMKVLIEIFGPGFASTFTLIAGVLGTFIGAIADVATGVFQALGGIIDFITGVFTGNWSKAWLGVKEIFGGIFTSLGGIVKGAMNLIIDGINFALRGIDRIILGWNEVKSAAGISGWTMPLGQIPKLANGGVVSSPTLAMMGEGGKREAVVPLENSSFIDGFASTIASAVSKAMGSTGGGSGGDVILKIGETEFGRVAIKSINAVHRQVGATLLVI